jgi:hypothetical protein
MNNVGVILAMRQDNESLERSWPKSEWMNEWRMMRVNGVIVIMFDDNNNNQCRENTSLNYNEVLVRKVVEVESNYKIR